MSKLICTKSSLHLLFAKHGRRMFRTTPLSAKNIMVCFDGTSNDALNQLPGEKYPGRENDQTFSNVLKLHILGGGAIDPDEDAQAFRDAGQISLYEIGCGSEERDGGVLALETVNQLAGNLSKQIDPMKEKLKKEYEKGDKLFVFGFSRGAASARKFACDLAKNGLAYGGDGGKEEVDLKPTIALLGCFDTVAMQISEDVTDIVSDGLQLRIPSCTDIDEDDFKVASIVEKAVHLVSLDDRRVRTFPPTLMGYEDRVEEVWFSGVHSDVGGYWTNDRGLADCTLTYMKKACEKAELKFLDAENVDEKAVTIPRREGLTRWSKIGTWKMTDKYGKEKEPLTIKPDPYGKVHHPSYMLKRLKMNEILKLDDKHFVEDGDDSRQIYVAKDDAVWEAGTPKIHISAYDHIYNGVGDKKAHKLDKNANLEKLAKYIVVDDNGIKVDV
eukprot:CAMPEP_0196826762 /NCGR_PEP_ID=MMETSP1362-20130617/93794_1 /TAXON_ID=163516 /ORGANISM="Leptocylindrus danicus, Strain CCMP1856" /LENGTH=441 /DNA_ID=CAMNT_0042207349 /DNA_START=81 /DNA_END=1406 /DNA_ORIENTATION=+